jgi:hypothetical protein
MKPKSSTVAQEVKTVEPECVRSFNMDWRILVFYPELKARDKIY